MGSIPFGRMTLFFILTAILFGVFGLIFNLINSFFGFYISIAIYSLYASGVCIVLGLIKAMFRLGGGDEGPSDVTESLCNSVPWFRLTLLSLVASLALFWIHGLVFPIGFTVFLVSFLMFFARLIFVTFR
jgi:hypothetical protein